MQNLSIEKQYHLALAISQNCYTIQLSHWLPGTWLSTAYGTLTLLCLPWPVKKICLWSTHCLRKTLLFVMQFFCYFYICHNACFFFWPCKKTINFLVRFSINWQVILFKFFFLFWLVLTAHLLVLCSGLPLLCCN